MEERETKKKRVLLWIVIVPALILVVFLIGAWSMFGTQLTAAMTVTGVDDAVVGCSTITVKDPNGNMLFVC